MGVVCDDDGELSGAVLLRFMGVRVYIPSILFYFNIEYIVHGIKMELSPK